MLQFQNNLGFLQLHSARRKPERVEWVGATFMEKSVCLRSSATTRKLRNFTNRSQMWQWVNAHGGCIISCCGLSYIYTQAWCLGILYGMRVRMQMIIPQRGLSALSVSTNKTSKLQRRIFADYQSVTLYLLYFTPRNY